MLKRTIIALVVLGILGGGAFLGFRHFRDSPERHLKRADAFFVDEQFDAARIEYMNVLRKDQQNTHALQQIAYSWVEQGAPFAALRYLRATVELEPENDGARFKLAEVWFALSQFGEARKEALAVLDRNPDNEEAILHLAKLSFGDEAIAETKERLTHFQEKPSALSVLAGAILAQREGDTATAFEKLEQALALDPESWEVQLTLANYYTFKNDQSKLRETLKTVSSLAPPRSKGSLNYAAYMVQQGEMAEAIALLEATCEAAPDYFPALIQLANLKRREKLYPEAIALVERVLASNPNNRGATLVKAQVFLDQGERPKAIEELENLDRRAQIPSNKLQLARFYLEDNEIANASTKLNEALVLNPSFADATLLLAQIELRTGGEEAAAGRLEHLLKTRPDLVKAQILLAGAYQRLQRLEEAANIFRAHLDDKEVGPAAHLALARVLGLQEKPAEARLKFLEAQRLRPDALIILSDLISLDISQGNYSLAHDAVRARLRIAETWGLLFMEGRIFVAEGKWDEARKPLMKALELNPGSLPIYGLLVSSYLAEQKPEEAILEINKSLESKPSNIRFLMLLALLHEHRGDPINAGKAYDKLLLVNPEFAPALNNLAYLYAGPLRQLERAEDLARKAHALAPEDPSINDTLGWILYQRGNFAEALPHLEQAGEKLAEVHEVQFHLGMTRSKMGQRKEAIAALDYATSALEPLADVEIARDELTALRDPTRQTGGKTIPELQTHLKAQPKDAAAHLQLALLLETQKDYHAAIASFEAATKINPSLAAAWIGQARIYGGPSRDLDRAIDAGRQARRLEASNPEIAALLGHLALQRSNKGDLDWAAGMLWEAAQKRKSPELLHDFAWADYLQGKLSEASQTMKSIIQTHPDSIQAKEAQRFLTLTNPGTEDWQTLVPVAEARLKEDPNDVPALMVRARTQPDIAHEIYQKLLKRLPDFARAKVRIATLYAQDPKQVAKAEPLARETLAALSDDSEHIILRSAIAYRKGEANRAIELLENLQKTTPLDADGLFYLGMACLDSNREVQGSKALRQALKADLDPTLAQEAAATLGISAPR